MGIANAALGGTDPFTGANIAAATAVHRIKVGDAARVAQDLVDVALADIVAAHALGAASLRNTRATHSADADAPLAGPATAFGRCSAAFSSARASRARATRAMRAKTAMIDSVSTHAADTTARLDAALRWTTDLQQEVAPTVLPSQAGIVA